MTPSTAPRSRPGLSLARGPVSVIGMIALVYGVSALIFGGHSFALHIPHGAVDGGHWIGLDVNGWTELLFVAAGLLLLGAAARHWTARTTAAFVGVVVIAAAIVAVIRGDGVFGIFAANGWTELVWAAGGVVLLIVARSPRVRRERGRTTSSTPPRKEQ